MITILIIIFCLYLRTRKEHFWFIPQNISNGLCDANNLINLNRHQCKRCANAGYCTMPNGESKCVEGDWRGSANGEDCVLYEYGNDYASLSLVDAPQPYFINTSDSWKWTNPIFQKREIPQPINEGMNFFHHSKPLKHHYNFIQ
jgi:hypothetical protein